MSGSDSSGQSPKPVKTEPPQTSSFEPVPTPIAYGTALPQQRIGVSYSREVRIGPLPDAEEFGRFKAVHPPAADWILDEAGKNGEHNRAMELIGARVAARDALLIRLLPFGVIVVFMVVFGAITFVNAWVGAAGLATTFAAVVLAYLKSFGSSGDAESDPAGAKSPSGGTPRPKPKQSPPA